MGYIDNLNLNEDGLQPWDGEGADPVPRGDYILRIADVETKTSKSGFPMLQFQLEVMESADGDTTHAGRTVRHWQSLKNTTTVRKRLLNLVRAAGVELDERGGFDSDDFLGREIVATLNIEERPSVQSDGTTKVYQNNTLFRERPVAEVR